MKSSYECIFLDRDGTLNFDSGYISSLDRFKFFHYTFEALRLLSKISKYFIIVTNQSGVSRGIINIKDLIKINSYIKKQFLVNDLVLLEIYYCTETPENASDLRKPGPGMFLKASQDYDLNLSKCLMIGDSHKDIVPAYDLDMDSMLVLTGNGKNDINKFDGTCKPNFIVKDLLMGARKLSK